MASRCPRPTELRPSTRRAALCLGLLLSSACGSDDPDAAAAAGTGGGGASAGGSAGTSAGGSAGTSDGDVASDLPYAPCSSETDVGGFIIELGADFTSVGGRVFDRVNPGLVPTTLMSEGDCRLVTLPNLLCDPACPASAQTCGPGNQCVPLPVGRSVGDVTVSGLVRDVEMTANANTGSYRATPPLPHPGFTTGADLRVSASGGDYAPFELRGWGIEPFQFTGETVDVSGGAPAALSWAPPTQAGPARVRAVLDINNHGSSSNAIECDFPDTGSAEIPAALIDALIGLGSSGFPTLGITRRTATSTSIEPGCVQLVVTTDILYSLDVSLEGLVSCNDDSMCPDGQTCKPVERFCE